MEHQGVASTTASSSSSSLSSPTVSLSSTSSNLTLADDVEQQTTREVKPPDLEPITKNKPDFPSDGGFTSTSGTPALDVEKMIEGHCCAAVLTPEPAAVQPGDHSSDYPQGGRLMGILAALLLSLFLVYLDIVSDGDSPQNTLEDRF